MEQPLSHSIEKVDIKESDHRTEDSKNAKEEEFTRMSERKLGSLENRSPSIVESENSIAHNRREDAWNDPFKFEFRPSLEDLCRKEG